MNEVRALQIKCSAAKSLAECEPEGAALLTASVCGGKARKVPRTTVRARSTVPTKQDNERRSTAGQASGTPHRKPKPAKPSGRRGGIGHQDVESVAELIALICDVPDNRKKRLKLAEALRERGLDESKVAAMYSGIAAKLSRSKETGAVGVAAAKLLFDVLKELAERLEPEKSAGSGDGNEAPQFVRLIHNVPRPVRTE
jgi:hypothetical protein